MSQPILIKKYGNRRLYDTSDSRYITLDELADKIQNGADVRVVDVNSGSDLTQVTLTQIIVEGRGAAHMLPVPLLTQLIRLGDDALAEFLGQYMSMTLEFYLRSKQNAAAMSPFNPFANLPFATADAFARLWQNSPFSRSRSSPAPQAMWDPSSTSQPAAPPPTAGPTAEDVAALRDELEELKRAIHSKGRDPDTRTTDPPPAGNRARRGSKKGGKKSGKKGGNQRGRSPRTRDQDS